MIITFNESENLARTLDKLAWAHRILIVDTFSTDETCDIARANPRVHLVQRRFDSFAAQCNFGLTHIQTRWVLSLDADYVVTDELRREIEALRPDGDAGGYSAAFTYCIHGHPLRASLYPPRVVLYRRETANYRDEGHGHRVQIRGIIEPLRGRIFHDDRKPLERWLAEQLRYAAREAEHLLSTPVAQLNRPDRVRRKILFAPFLVFFYTLLAKRLILDGWPGWYYVFQRTLAEIILSLHLIEARLGKCSGSIEK